MKAKSEVAMFVDLENLRYGLLNNYGQEPQFSALVDKAKQYGRPSIMRAYADFTEHPDEIGRQLQVAGIECINIAVKRSIYTEKSGKQVERVKNAADMWLALDAIIEALEADKSGNQKTFLIVTGDRDYVKLVTLLRNKFGQQVVIAGVPGCVAKDLVDAAGKQDLIEAKRAKPIDSHELKRAIVNMIVSSKQLPYWTLKIIDQWSNDARQGIPGTAKEKRDAIGQLLGDNVLTTSMVSDGTGGQRKEAQLDINCAKKLGYL